MERKIILGLVAFTLLAIAAAIILPGGRTLDAKPKLPWLIEVDEQGAVRVFDITLGRTTLAEAREGFETEGKVNLFAAPDRAMTVEAFFEDLYLSGLRADLVLTLGVDPGNMERMYQRGLRVSQLGSGSKKVSLHPDDLRQVLGAPVMHITYSPAASLDAALIQNRFGHPAQKRSEATGLTHWLYPEKGLDIAWDAKGNGVLQYVPIKDFDRLAAPLQDAHTLTPQAAGGTPQTD
jgi:hypothetical protein